MAWALVQSTRFPCAVSSEDRKVLLKQCCTKKRLIKMKCSLQTPPMRVRDFSGFRRINAIDNIRHGFRSTVTSAWIEKAFQIVPIIRFTYDGVQVTKRAQEEARRLGHKFVGTEMILLGIIGDKHGIAGKVFQSTGIKLEDARNEVEKMIGRGSEPVCDQVETPFTPRAHRLFQVSLEEAQRTDVCNTYKTIGSEHLLLGLLREGGCVVSRVLWNLGAYPNNIRTKVIEMVNNKRPKSCGNGMMPTLKNYGINFTELAIKRKMGSRWKEPQIERVVHILDKHTKRNPCLVEHGVGKTSIVEGVAQKLFDGYYDPSDSKPNGMIISLDMRLLVRGKVEERLKKIMEDIEQQDTRIILFIDEVYTLSGTGVPEGAVGAINILREALASSKLQCIGATTPDEYRKHMENDPALERLFQPVKVLEPTVDETINILMGIRKKYEDYHGVNYTHEALVAAAQLSYQYISDGVLPGKAIDLIDEAGSRVKEKHYYIYPQLLDELKDMKELRPIECVEEELDRVKQLRSITKEEISLVPDRDEELAGMLRDLEIDHKFDVWSIEERIEEMKKAGVEEPIVTKRDIEDTISSWDLDK